MSGCRIARVRHKASGKTIEIISRPERPEISDQLVRAGIEIGDAGPSGLVAFFIVGVDGEGAYRAGWRVLNGAPFGPTLFSAFLSEIARREVVMRSEVEHFCVQQGWVSE